MPAPIILIRRSNPSHSSSNPKTIKKKPGRNKEDYQSARDSILRNRTAKNLDRPRIFAAGRGRGSGQSQGVRNILSQRNITHDHSPAVTTDGDREQVRYSRQRIRRRARGPGGSHPSWHYPR